MTDLRSLAQRHNALDRAQRAHDRAKYQFDKAKEALDKAERAVQNLRITDWLPKLEDTIVRLAADEPIAHLFKYRTRVFDRSPSLVSRKDVAEMCRCHHRELMTILAGIAKSEQTAYRGYGQL